MHAFWYRGALPGGLAAEKRPIIVSEARRGTKTRGISATGCNNAPRFCQPGTKMPAVSATGPLREGRRYQNACISGQ